MQENNCVQGKNVTIVKCTNYGVGTCEEKYAW